MKESTIDALAGAIAGIFTNLITHPLDTIKVQESYYQIMKIIFSIINSAECKLILHFIQIL